MWLYGELNKTNYILTLKENDETFHLTYFTHIMSMTSQYLRVQHSQAVCCGTGCTWKWNFTAPLLWDIVWRNIFFCSCMPVFSSVTFWSLCSLSIAPYLWWCMDWKWRLKLCFLKKVIISWQMDKQASLLHSVKMWANQSRVSFEIVRLQHQLSLVCAMLC